MIVDFINWKSYFKNEQISEYNLKNTNNIKLYNTSDITMPGEYQINNMHTYLGELVMMYYIWKHNLKSKYICKISFIKTLLSLFANKFDKFVCQILIYIFLLMGHIRPNL